MERTWRFWQAPPRLPRRQAQMLGLLAACILVLAGASLASYAGNERFLHGGALALVSLANFALVAGSLVPDERGGRRLRLAVIPLSLVMLIALFASAAVLREEMEPIVLAIGALPVLVVGLIGVVRRRA